LIGSGRAARLPRCAAASCYSDRIAILHRLRPDATEIDVEAARNPHEIARVDFSGSPASQSRIVARIRAHWPAVRIVLRADSGFAREALMNWYEANGVDLLFGLARNERLVGEIAAELAAADKDTKTTGRPARRFTEFAWSTRDSWSRQHRVVAIF
jgi:hypothetical protein